MKFMLEHREISQSLHKDTIETRLERLIFALLLILLCCYITNFDVWLPFDKGKSVIGFGLGSALILRISYRPIYFFHNLGNFSPAIILSLSMAAWAAIVHLWNGTDKFDQILNQAIGAIILFSIYCSLNSVWRVKLMMLTFTLAILISAIFAMFIPLIGIPAQNIWLTIYTTIEGTIDPEDIIIVFGHGRSAGLSTHTHRFAYLLTTAIPFAFLLYLPNQPRKRLSNTSMNIVRCFIVGIFLTVAITNGSRSLLLALIVGTITFIAFSIDYLPDFLWRRLLYILLGASIIISMFLGSVFNEKPGTRESLNLLLENISKVRGEGGRDLNDLRELKSLMSSSSHRFIKIQPRLFKYNVKSVLLRIPISITGIRYALEYPLGTGRYSPESRHLSPGVPPRWAGEILGTVQHNQFLATLVRYGFPGLILAILFYFHAYRSLINSLRLAKQSRCYASFFLVAPIAVALTVYITNSMFHTSGIFTGNWRHFFLIGLIFSIERLLAADSMDPD